MAFPSRLRDSCFLAVLPAVLALGGCSASPSLQTAPRNDDAFIVAGRPVHSGTRVVTWLDAGGLDAYRTARRDDSGTPESFGARRNADGRSLAPGDLDALLGVVDQVVLHYDGFGNSRDCFAHLAERQLSAHFLIDVDGTVYQTLDLQERAYHATVANNRSIGIEIANLGAFPISDAGAAAIQNPVRGTVHDNELVQPNYTPEQYAAIEQLIGALCRTFPRIARVYPRDSSGAVVMSRLPDGEFATFRGILGHFHIQDNKVDPGPAFQWERIFP